MKVKATSMLGVIYHPAQTVGYAYRSLESFNHSVMQCMGEDHTPKAQMNNISHNWFTYFISTKVSSFLIH